MGYSEGRDRCWAARVLFLGSSFTVCACTVLFTV